ncbi:quaternary amine ABC transporter ATP-binding protein [Curvivirga aplysinae]|uniref:quaternary amine ABC transporter ATP-binding protein n=1 Tax=Curvivirga aplysinae TaxID=2529852 RepID=UPI0012BBF95A|nr:betaine/proline/choline family ABC transporter ATP-binding protein [Curvivirga aplysinae]MTI08827.1 ATP-binding cassette domain-containing protein [Curvivirga aplysinae]
MPSQSVKLSCKNIWKVFGGNAEKIMNETNSENLDETLKEQGCVVGVRQANIEIYEGEIFVIMGLSGSGKSTLVRLLSRLIEPTAGEIIFDGKNLLDATEEEMIEIRRHKMGMVFQHFALLPHLTVLGNVAFPLEVQGVSKVEREKQARQVIELVGLKGRENYYPSELSGGQQQRVGIARSLAVEPELWFLDEPFSALDPLIRREMQDEFLRLQNVLHKTITFITHDFDEAIRLADRIAIMKDGRVVQIGTAEELVLNPADAYVEEFTSHVSKAKVLTVGSVMAAPLNANDVAGHVSVKDLIADVAVKVEAADKPLAVLDANGEVVGSLSRDKVISVLVAGEGYAGD